MVDTSERFELRPGSYEKVRRQYAFRSIAVMLILLVPMTWIFHLNNPKTMEDYPFLYIGLWAMLVGYILFRLFRQDKPGSDRFYSYQLTIHAYSITRSSSNSPTVSIPLNQVKSIQRLYNGGYRVASTNATDVIYIPDYIQNRERVEELLQSIHPFAVSSPWAGFQRLLPYYALVPAGLFFGMLATHDKIVVGITAPLFVATMVLALIYAQRSKNAALRRGRWFYMMMIAVTAWYIVQVFTGRI